MTYIVKYLIWTDRNPTEFDDLPDAEIHAFEISDGEIIGVWERDERGNEELVSIAYRRELFSK